MTKTEYNDGTRHIMVDLETMGKGPDAAIIGIAAVEFDFTGMIIGYYAAAVDLDSCLKLGLVADASTIGFWLENAAALDWWIKGDTPKVDIESALLALWGFFQSCGPDVKVWSNGAGFDLPILRTAYKKAGIEIPWKFWNERDVRTMVSLAPEVRKGIRKPERVHNAVVDCEYQIEYLVETYKHLVNE